jgi:cell division topological specificity factor
MAGWLERLFGHEGKTAQQAKERLKLVLIHDRTALTPDMMEKMKNELLQVISRYIEIDPQLVRISMSQEGREQRLLADIPLKSAETKKK